MDDLFTLDEVSAMMRKMEENITHWRRAIAERDAALAELAEVKKNMLRFSADGMRITRENTKADALELALSLIAERDALAEELATLKKRVADAERVVALGYVEHSAGKFFLPSHGVDKYGTYALVRLEEGET